MKKSAKELSVAKSTITNLDASKMKQIVGGSCALLGNAGNCPGGAIKK